MPAAQGMNTFHQIQKTQGISPGKRTLRSKRYIVVPHAASTELSDSLAQGVRALKAQTASTEAPTVQPVPGTEILAVTTTPAPPPPPPSQGMDFVLDKIAAQPSIPSSKSLDQAGSNVLSALDSLNGDASQAAAQTSAAAADAANALGSVVGGTVSGAADVVGAGAAAASAAAGEVAGQASAALSQIQQLFEKIISEVGEEASIVQENLNSLTGGIQSTTSNAVSGVVGQFESQVNQLLGQLPPGVKDALVAAGNEAYHAAQAAASNPQAGAAGLGVGIALPILLLIAANAGYAGSLSPTQAEEYLQTQDALLVDVRAEAKRLENGMPELKRGARGKGAALSPVRLPPSISRRVKNADALALEMLGAQIASLSRVSPGTRVIIMDDTGSTAKKVAKAAAAAGVRRAYVLQGGFRAWTAAGFKSKTGTAEYDSNPLGAVTDAAESVVEEAATLVKTPTNIASGAGGLIALATVVYNYHLVFRFIGVLGLEATVLLRVLDYESPQDALDDLNALYNSAMNLAALPVKAADTVATVTGQLQQQNKGEPQQQTSE